MQKLQINQTLDSLPTWDSVEAVFFVICGLSMGIVLGVLFPSLWRTFRRRFRKESQYAPFDNDKWATDKGFKPSLEILSNEDTTKDGESEDEENSIKNSWGSKVNIANAFILSRYFFQIGQPRESVKIYINILTNEQVSKEETNQALFELSQVYKTIGLFGRAFDTGFEILNRKPTNNKVFMHLISICIENKLYDKLAQVFHVYKGNPSPNIQRALAHSLSQVGEEFLEKNQVSHAIDYAHRALRWDRHSGRALILLWMSTNQEIWNNPSLDLKTKWVALAATLQSRIQVSVASPISCAAGAKHLSVILSNLLQTPDFIEAFPVVEQEFRNTLELKKISAQMEKKLRESIFYAILLLQDAQETKNPTMLFEVLFDVVGKGKGYYQALQALINDNPSPQSDAVKVGFSTHRCERCGSFFSSFQWQCNRCGELESLMPVVSSIP